MILRNEVIGFAGFGELSVLAIRRRFPRIWAAYDSDRMVASGHSLPIHSAPVPNNVRYASDSDHSRHESELTLCAHSNAIMRDSAGHRARRPNGIGLMGTLMGTLWERADRPSTRLLNPNKEMARPERFELPTPRFVVWGLCLRIFGCVRLAICWQRSPPHRGAA